MINREVSIIARIENRRDHDNGHVFLTVKNTTGEIEVPIFAGKEIETKGLVAGKAFRINGSVGLYKDKLQLIPSGPLDLHALFGNEHNHR